MNLSCIDRMYVTEPIGDWGGLVGILPGTCFLDHSPIMLGLDEGDRRASVVLRIPESVQIDDGIADQIVQL